MVSASCDDPRPFHGGQSSWRRKVVFALVVVVGVLAAAELLCRFAVASDLMTKPRTFSEKWITNGWIVDPLLGWSQAPGRTSNRGGVLALANSLGLRDRELPVEKPPEEIRILAIGDSTVLGFGVPWELTFSERLEVLLKKRSGRTVQVINAGVPGYASCQSMLYLRERGLALSPDVVIVQTNFNDRRSVFADGAADSERHFHAMSRAILRREYLGRSMAFALFRDLVFSGGDFLASGKIAAYQEIDLEAPPRASLPAYETNMRQIVRLSRDAGASVIFVGLLDNPKMIDAMRHGAQHVEQKNWPEAEHHLRRALEDQKVYVIPVQRLLNRVYQATGRIDEIQTTIPIKLVHVVVTGYTPVTVADPYIHVLRELSEELDVPLVFPRAEGVGGQEIYLDFTHLNARGHETLARELATTVASLAPFNAILSDRAARRRSSSE